MTCLYGQHRKKNKAKLLIDTVRDLKEATAQIIFSNYLANNVCLIQVYEKKPQ